MIIVGDCIERMRELPDSSVDAICTDPPAGIAFMGREWDRDKGGRDEWVAWLADVFREAYRIAKPGAHAFVWALPRTSGWTHRALEDAGWEVRDCVTHLFGSGFPKSHDVSKAIDRMAGAEREVVGSKHVTRVLDPETLRRDNYTVGVQASGGEIPITAPATPEAAQWAGWGTALKPAAEFWYLARKPLIGTVAANVLQHGTGALNVDACRIEGPKGSGNWAGQSPGKSKYGGDVYFASVTETVPTDPHPSGRWPANVVLGCCGNDPHDPNCAATMLDAQSGERETHPRKRHGQKTPTGNGHTHGAMRPIETERGFADSGGASRFFYVAKASRRERNAGLEGMVNGHPTVKPLALCEWLVKLVTPPGGTVLDPFAGSGSIGCAAVRLGFRFIGIEMDSEYAEIAERRIAYWAAQRPTVLQPALPMEGAAD